MSDYPIPDQALQAHIAIIGKTGSGKTYAAKGAVENLLDAKARVLRAIFQLGGRCERDAITALNGYKKTTRDKYLYLLEVRKLVTFPRAGFVQAAELLFD